MGLLIIAVEDVKRHVCNVSSVIIIVRFVRLDLSLPVLGFAHSVLKDVWHAMDLWAATTVHQDILSYLLLMYSMPPKLFILSLQCHNFSNLMHPMPLLIYSSNKWFLFTMWFYTSNTWMSSLFSIGSMYKMLLEFHKE